MRVVFMGTPVFAVPSLRALVAGHEVAAVYTRPDRPAGRGREPAPSAVARAAQELGVPVERPETLRGEAAVQGLDSLAPEVVCVVAYGLVLPQEILDVPRFGCVNVHPSLLPRWRGAAPVERAILSGDERSGVSIMRMDAGLDTGPVALRVSVDVDGMTSDALRERLADEGAVALLQVLDAISDGSVTWTPQGESGVTYADKVFAREVALDPQIGSDQLARRVRASSRSAPSRAVIDGREVTVLAARPTADALEPGRVAIADGSPLLGTIAGALLVDRLVPAGRSSMTGPEFARGARLGPLAAWEAPR